MLKHSSPVRPLAALCLPLVVGSVPALLLVFPALLFFLFLQLVQSFSLLLCCTLDIFDTALESTAIRRTEHAQTLQKSGGQLKLFSLKSVQASVISEDGWSVQTLYKTQLSFFDL